GRGRRPRAAPAARATARPVRMDGPLQFLRPWRPGGSTLHSSAGGNGGVSPRAAYAQPQAGVGPGGAAAHTVVGGLPLARQGGENADEGGELLGGGIAVQDLELKAHRCVHSSMSNSRWTLSQNPSRTQIRASGWSRREYPSSFSASTSSSLSMTV